VRAPVIDRAQPAAPQQVGHLIRIDVVALVALSGLPAPIADDDPIGERGDQVVQPLRPGSLLEHHVEGPAHSAQELHDRRPIRRQHAPGDHPPAVRPHRGHRGCLMDVQRDILRTPFHESRSLLWSTGLGRLHGSNMGCALNMR